VRFTVFAIFSEYGTLSVNSRRSSAPSSANFSDHVPGSTSIAIRALPGSVKWKSQAGHTMPFSSSSLR
jgi:hypothetical protein